MKKVIVTIAAVMMLGVVSAADNIKILTENVLNLPASINQQTKLDWEVFNESLKSVPTADRAAKLGEFRKQQVAKRDLLKDSIHKEKMAALKLKLDATTLNAQEKEDILKEEEKEYQENNAKMEVMLKNRQSEMKAIMDDPNLTKEQKQEKLKALRQLGNQQPTKSATEAK